MTTQTPSGPDDALRTLAELGEPDSRMANFSVREGGSFRVLSQADRHDAIEQMALTPSVPENIRVQYDTARNVYLYAWHVYRFHVVAEHQALASLELALRFAAYERGFVDSEGRPTARSAASAVGKAKLPRQLALSQLLTWAHTEGLIRNERLSQRLQWAQDLAERRASTEAFHFMHLNDLTEKSLPDEPAVPTKEELEFDWVGDFVERLPKLRNEYAHGTQMLHATVLKTFAIVSDLINQLWPAVAESA